MQNMQNMNIEGAQVVFRSSDKDTVNMYFKGAKDHVVSCNAGITAGI